MSKRPNLAAIAAAAGSTRRPPEQSDPPPQAEPVLGNRQVAGTRVGTKQVAAHFPEDVAWQLRALAVDRKTTVQSLLGEALNDLFAKYGRPELVPIER